MASPSAESLSIDIPVCPNPDTADLHLGHICIEAQAQSCVTVSLLPLQHELGDVSGHLAGFHITEGAHSLSLAGRNLNPTLGLAARGGSPPRGVDELDDPPGFPPTAVRPVGPVSVQVSCALHGVTILPDDLQLASSPQGLLLTAALPIVHCYSCEQC